jgi:hypothetical protein
VPAGNRTFMPLSPRGTPTPPDLFALYAQANNLTLEGAIDHLARLAGLLPTDREGDGGQ